MREILVSSLCQRTSVAKRLFDSVLAKNQIFLNETDGRRLDMSKSFPFGMNI